MVPKVKVFNMYETMSCKGGGLIILDTPEYVRAYQQHLSSVRKNVDQSLSPYYCKVDTATLTEARAEVLAVIKEARDKEIITEQDFKVMDPTDKGPGRFYCTSKVHKSHTEGQAPPECPIVSGSGSVTEKISAFLQHHIKDLSKGHDSYVQDTPDMLRTLRQIDNLPPNTMIVTVDVVSANIRCEDAVSAVWDCLETRADKSVPTEFLVKLLQLVMKWNLFEYDSELFLQLEGMAMGTKAAPNIADIVMAVLDTLILKTAAKFGDGVYPVHTLKRFLDDILMLFTGNAANLHKFIDQLNQLHPTLKFTVTHTRLPGDDSCDCDCPDRIPFLDTALKIVDGKISSTLFRKPSDRNKYLLPSSCHPPHCPQNIPFSLALRIVRICSETEERDLHLATLREMLLSRDYKPCHRQGYCSQEGCQEQGLFPPNSSCHL